MRKTVLLFPVVPHVGGRTIQENSEWSDPSSRALARMPLLCRSHALGRGGLSSDRDARSIISKKQVHAI